MVLVLKMFQKLLYLKYKYSMQKGKSVINLIPVKYWHKNSLSEFALASFQPPGVLKLMVTCFWFPPLGCPEDQAVNFNFVPSLQNHLLFPSWYPPVQTSLVVIVERNVLVFLSITDARSPIFPGGEMDLQ